LSPRAEGLGEALAVLFGVADAERAREITRRSPVVPFGVPSFWPYIPDVSPYHNAGIWPQVVGFWTWAAAEARNTEAVRHGLASLIRPAALFLTNKENMVAASGHFEGTELNSDRLVGSVGAMLAAVQRVLLGMRFHPDRLVFEPFVPAEYDGVRTFGPLRYRDATITVTVRGFGSAVERALLNGQPLATAEIPGDLRGEHALEIVLDGRLPEGGIHLVDNLNAPATPHARIRGDSILWKPVVGASEYVVYRNGRLILETAGTVAAAAPLSGLVELQVLARGARGVQSFLSEPLRRSAGAEQRFQPPGPLQAEVGGYTGLGYLRLTPDRNRSVRIPVTVERPGVFSVDVRYANGSGPINTGSAAGVRTLRVDGERAGVLVMPQRGRDLWDDWGYSSPVPVHLPPGQHTFELAYTPTDVNMSRDTNDVLFDHLRITRRSDTAETTEPSEATSAAGTADVAGGFEAGVGTDRGAAMLSGRDRPVEAAIDSLLKRMTVEEKLGQLTLHVGRWTDVGPRVQERGEEVIRAGRIGTLYGVFGAEYTRELQRVAVEETRLGIPLMFAHDVLHGFRTTFPMPIAQAASWDTAAVRRAARVSAVEASAHGLHWTFAPMVDIARDPRWGRVVEGPGEDPYLGTALAAAQVRGFQGEDLSRPNTVAATAKHFVAYGAAEAGRDYNTVDLSERTVREVYLPPFEAAAEAGVAAVMPAFNEIAGIPMHAHRGLIEGVLRGTWGWDGVVVSDYTGILELTHHGVAATPTEAGLLALRSGVDVDIVSDIYLTLEDEVRSGRLDEALVDRAVRRVLRLKHALGLFEDPYRYSDPARERDSTLTAGHRSAARDLARRSIVLLKNEGVLPLSKDVGRLAVIGPLADDRRATLGTWTAAGRVEHTTSVLEAIRAAVGPGTEVVAELGLPAADLRNDGDPEDEPDKRAAIEGAVRAAVAADAVVLILGEPESWTAEAASRASVELPAPQLELARAVLETGTPTAVLLMNGRPLAIPWLAEEAPAIMETWYLGVEHGPAVADVLFGDHNPSGRLPVTFPRATGQIPSYYAHRSTGRPPAADEKYTSKYIDVHWSPLYPFGHGLSYTTFEYSDLELSREAVEPGGSIEVSVTVTNTGAREGEEVVQLYVQDEVASVTRPVRELKGFQRVTLEPGAGTRAVFTLGPEELRMLDADLRTVVEPGAFRVFVGGSSTAELSARFRVVPE
ncbi:MAG: beta-glucosidase BglX, partial [Gemmatimonadota bacterium]